jgi:hypothetical protein
MARLLISAVLTLMSVIFTLGDALAVPERRVALVIGNSDYKNSTLTLLNPKNDAADVAAVLKSLDFEVQLVTNVGKRELDGVLERFARQASTADSALFYYAGHAIQFQGKNYLMPVDAELEDEISIRFNLVSIDEARSALDRASGVKIMVLDACRNNPIADQLNRQASGQTRSAATTRGLARIDKTQGMVVSYATAADDVALDGSNARNSPYTAALIKRMQEPGLEIEMMFRRVAQDVNIKTNGRQRPETSITLLSEYYLNQSDRRIWDGMRETADIPAIQDFLRRFPNSVSSLDAKYRLDILERAKRDREDEEARIQREAYQRELAEQAAAARMEIARLEEERKRAEKGAAEQELQRQADDKKKMAAIEEQRKAADRQAAEMAAQQKKEEQDRLAKLERDRQAAALALAQRQEAEQRRVATEKLAALEQQRVKAQQEVAEREEARKREQIAKQKAIETCNSEQATVAGLGNDEAKLKIFATKSECEDARVRAQSMLASLQADRERVERACSAEEKQLNVLKTAGAAGRDKLIDLQKSLTCDRLGPMIAAALTKANEDVRRVLIRSSQAELRRVGCYRGPENGELSELTQAAIKRVNVARNKPDEAAEVSDDFLSDLKKLDAPVCAPPRTEPEDKPVASRPVRPRVTARPTPAAPREREAPSVRVESRPSPSAGAVGTTRIQGLSF